MSKLKLVYFDFSGSRGEECRLALFASGADFEDCRLSQEQWASLKPQTPYGSLPVLEVEGAPAMAQSNAILAYIGRQYNLHPQDLWTAALHEAVMQSVEDLRAALSPLTKIKDDAEKKRTREEFIAGYLSTWARNLEKQIEGPFLSGAAMSVADIKLFVICHSLASGVYDYFPKDVLSPFEKLERLYRAVLEHPKISEWRSRHSK